MADHFNIILPTDVFPPRAGGAGWSTHALALALLQRGHQVMVIVPQQNAHGCLREDVLGVPTLRWGYWAPNLPFLQNYYRHERLWQPLSDIICEEAEALTRTRPENRLIIHAQHVQVTPAAVLAGHSLNAPVAATVRDHWPWDYFATGLHGDRLPYPAQNWPSLATDLPARLGPLRGALAVAAIPYMLAHVRRRQGFLRQAGAVVAVSAYMAGRLRAIVAPERIHVIPNMVDLDAINTTIATPPTEPLPEEPFLLYAGKLERNKGAHLLPEIIRALLASGEPVSLLPPLIIAGDGPLRPELERELAALGVRVRFLAWVEHDQVLRLMARCTLLLYTSAWGEPLTRVLLEASACGAPILAMPTGGTASILEDRVSGALEPTIAGFAHRLAELLKHPEQRTLLSNGARHTAQQRFSQDVVVEQVEQLYKSVLKP